MTRPEISDLRVLQISATEGQTPPQTVLVIVKASTESEAQDAALVVLARNGLTFGAVLQQKPLTNDMADEPGYLRNAIPAAIEHGGQLVIYDK